MKTGTASLPLHYGSAPRWLFEKMTRLAREISIILITEYGPDEYLKRLSDPSWFQAFGCILGFDWHSSGVTTTTCGAIKEGLRPIEKDLGIFVCGGKGKTSRKTPQEITQSCLNYRLSIHVNQLCYASKMAAKVDNNALQDGYQLYHHNFFFTKEGKWAVIQQGMKPSTRASTDSSALSPSTVSSGLSNRSLPKGLSRTSPGQAGWARRYHWLSDNVKNFVNEPHTAIASQFSIPIRSLADQFSIINLVANESKNNRTISAKVASQKPEKIVRTIKKLQVVKLPARHKMLISDINPQNLEKIFLSTYEREPENFEELLGMKGVGAKTIRALSLISELVYGAPVSTKDPARYSFAHGGKDGIPYPVNRQTYDQSIEFLREAINKAKLGYYEKLHALRRLLGSRLIALL